MKQLSLIVHLLLIGVIHNGSILLKLIDLNLVLLQLLIPLLPKVLDLPLEPRHYVIVVPLVVLLQVRDLILKRYLVLKLLVILHFQLTLDLGLIRLLLCVPFMQHLN